MQNAIRSEANVPTFLLLLTVEGLEQEPRFGTVDHNGRQIGESRRLNIGQSRFVVVKMLLKSLQFDIRPSPLFILSPPPERSSNWRRKIGAFESAELLLLLLFEKLFHVAEVKLLTSFIFILATQRTFRASYEEIRAGTLLSAGKVALLVHLAFESEALLEARDVRNGRVHDVLLLSSVRTRLRFRS